MESSQQFHLKWNNHSVNTLSSFQHLLDTNSLVDVSLTCCSGKTVTAHRMVLAACSEYFYRLFKELPEKHPVIVFKDASEEIVRDLLLFMYKGEVEVQESYLNDFLKFADTLQVKGLSQSDRAADGSSKRNNTPTQQQQLPESPIKSNGSGAAAAAAAAAACSLPDMTKSYLAAAGFAAAGKFPPMFPLPTEPSSAADLLTHLSSPNLYRALHTRKYPNPLTGKFPDPHDNPILKNMPSFLNLKKMFGNNPDLSALYARAEDDSDSIAERSPPPPLPAPPAAHQASNPSQREENNGLGDDNNEPSPMEADYGAAMDLNRSSELGSDPRGGHDSDSSTTPSVRRGGSKQAAGRGSRLERMIAAEYKIMSEYTEQNQDLPVMTPELMKSRRTHSLQLAIGEILHNRASVQSAATKYHIPRETLRRHYQRYLKAMGIQKAPATAASAGGGGGGPTAAVRSAVAINNNAKPSHTSMDTSADESSNGFSSLMDIGQAYGIWNADLDGSDFKSRMKDDAMRRAAAAMSAAAAAAAAMAAANEDREEKEKDLVIDEDDSIGSPGPREDEEDDEELDEEDGEAEPKKGDEKGTGLEEKKSDDAPTMSKTNTMETMA